MEEIRTEKAGKEIEKKKRERQLRYGKLKRKKTGQKCREAKKRKWKRGGNTVELGIEKYEHRGKKERKEKNKAVKETKMGKERKQNGEEISDKKPEVKVREGVEKGNEEDVHGPEAKEREWEREEKARGKNRKKGSERTK